MAPAKIVTANHDLIFMTLATFELPNVAPHLPPPRRQVGRKQHIQIRLKRRSESTGGG